MTALWHAFVRASLRGRMLVCTSIKSLGDVLRVPMIARAAVKAILSSLHLRSVLGRGIASS